MNGEIAGKLPEAHRLSPKFLVTVLLALFFVLLLGWTARSILLIEPVPLVPCRTCSQKCPCPRLSGAIRCGCPE